MAVDIHVQKSWAEGGAHATKAPGPLTFFSCAMARYRTLAQVPTSRPAAFMPPMVISEQTEAATIKNRGAAGRVLLGHVWIAISLLPEILSPPCEAPVTDSRST